MLHKNIQGIYIVYTRHIPMKCIYTVFEMYILKNQISRDKAANIITKEMIFSQLKTKSKGDFLKLYRRLVIIFNPILNRGVINKQFTDLNKGELFTKLNNIYKKINKAAIKVLKESNVFTTAEEMEAYKN